MAKQTIEAGHAKSERKADIIFCIDATGSMAPCFEGIIKNIQKFIEGLDSEGAVDWRFKLLAYRDKHTDPTSAWHNFSFTTNASEFVRQLQSIEPSGGRTESTRDDDRESTLDALYMAIKSDWRTYSGLQRVVVLLTDADSHPTLHSSTYNRPDDPIDRVIQEYQTLKHSLLFMIAPDLPIYNRLNKSMQAASKKVFFKPQAVDKDNSSVAQYSGLSNVKFDKLLEMIAKTISSSF